MNFDVLSNLEEVIRSVSRLIIFLKFSLIISIYMLIICNGFHYDMSS